MRLTLTVGTSVRVLELSALSSVGADPFLSRVRSELMACGVVVGPQPDEADPIGLLTPQENAVARLVAAGRTNREIADALILSQKTVAYQLSHGSAELAARRPFER